MYVTVYYLDRLTLASVCHCALIYTYIKVQIIYLIDSSPAIGCLPKKKLFQASTLFGKGESPEYSGKAVVYLAKGTYSIYFLIIIL